MLRAVNRGMENKTKTTYIYGVETMTYILTKVGRNEAILEDLKGNSIKMVFSEHDDHETEDKITYSLLTSYEKRMKENCESEVK